MKNTLTFILVFFLGSTLYSQTHFVGLHGGVNVSRIGSFAADASKLGPVAGINYELRFSRIFSFQTGLMYEQRGGKIKKYLFDNPAQDFYTRNYPLTTQHISLPVTIGMVSGGTTYISGHMGLIGSYTLGAESVYPFYQNGRYTDIQKDESHMFKKINIILILEGGVGTAISNRLNLEGKISLQTGATTVERNALTSGYDPDPSEITIKFPDYPHLAVAVSVGLKYRFGKEVSE